MFQSITFATEKGSAEKNDPFAYATKLPAIKAHKGTVTFKSGLNIIVGSNGSGKSTVLNALAMALAAKQSGRSVLTETWIRQLSPGFNSTVTDSIKIDHDAQPVIYLDPRETPGLSSGHFDDDFMSLGIQAIQNRHLSTGETSEHRFREVMLTLMGSIAFPEKVEEKISENTVNDLWANLIRDARAKFLTATCEKGQPTILMDEPDTGLDAKRAMSLWSILTSPEVTSRFQIIVVSHSPLAMMVKDAHFIEMEKGYAKECQTLAKDFGKVDYFNLVKQRSEAIATEKAKAEAKSSKKTKPTNSRMNRVVLTRNQLLAVEYLESRADEWVTPTEVGREVGNKLGKPDRHSSFGSPLCKKLVEVGLAERHPDKGWYRATETEEALR